MKLLQIHCFSIKAEVICALKSLQRRKERRKGGTEGEKKEGKEVLSKEDTIFLLAKEVSD
jgi:hypothetical protein